MEKEHVTIIVLLVIIVLVSLKRKPSDQVSAGEAPESESQERRPGQYITAAHIRNREDIPTAAHIRNRIGLGAPNKPGLTSYIRHRETDNQPAQGFYLGNQQIQNRNHSMYHSQFIRHHLKNDHRREMFASMDGDLVGDGNPDSAGHSF